MNNAAIILTCCAVVCVTLWDALRRWIAYEERKFADATAMRALETRVREHHEKTLKAIEYLSRDTAEHFAKLGAQDMTTLVAPSWRKNG